MSTLNFRTRVVVLFALASSVFLSNTFGQSKVLVGKPLAEVLPALRSALKGWSETEADPAAQRGSISFSADGVSFNLAYADGKVSGAAISTENVDTPDAAKRHLELENVLQQYNKAPKRNMEGSTVTLQFPDSEVQMVLAFYGRLTGAKIEASEQITGKITVMSPAPEPSVDAIKRIEEALRQKGFSVVREAKTIRVLKASGL